MCGEEKETTGSEKAESLELGDTAGVAVAWLCHV